MSKILVLDDKQFREVRAIYEETMRNSMVPQDMKITSFYHSIRCAFEDAEKKNRSVLEWHPVSVSPTIKTKVLLRLNNGNVMPDFVFYFIKSSWAFANHKIDEVKEWAYLPE